MLGKIGLEEHFSLEETLEDSLGQMPQVIWSELRHRLLDIQDTRLRLMDAHGMELMLLSLNAPAVQSVADPRGARELARRANDFLAEAVAKQPTRFQGLATSPPWKTSSNTSRSPRTTTAATEGRCDDRLEGRSLINEGEPAG